MNRLKSLREKKNMKQSELGKLLNVKNAAISKYESGKVPLTADTLIELANIFNESIDYILGVSDQSNPIEKREAENMKNTGVKVKKPVVTTGYYEVEDVMVRLGCKATKAQNVIRELNDELEAKGFKRYPRGKISKVYFDQRYL